MSQPYKSCEIELEFADADYLFRLPKKQLAELQERAGPVGERVPIGALWRRVCLTGDYYVEDLYEVVRLGLIGGGLDPQDARKLIDRYCDKWPLEVWHRHAVAILGACVEGYGAVGTDSEEPKKTKAATKAGSTSPPPTQSASKKASRPRKSTSSPSGSGKA